MTSSENQDVVKPVDYSVEELGDYNWDTHWDAVGAIARESPANQYRYRLILEQLGRVRAGDRLLDIGSGQGAFALLAAGRHPDLKVRGIEYSAYGVERAQNLATENRVNATFRQRDLLVGSDVPSDERHWANLAVCTEVLEHVDEPAELLRHSLDYLEPGCFLVVTVPGGPRSARDVHIGHRRHFDVARLHGLLAGVGLEQIEIHRAGFPFFNLYKLALVARGKALIKDLSEPVPTASDSTTLESRLKGAVQSWAMKTFEFLFKLNLDDTPFGWQLVATAVVPRSVAS